MGYEAARQKTEAAAARGEELHGIVEQYLKNDPNCLEGSSNLARSLFYKTYPKLNSIDNIRAQEYPLFSHKLKTAGTVDCVAEVNGELSVIDFKTSEKDKKASWLTDYWLQTTAYSIMVEELYGISVPTLTIIIVSEMGWAQMYQSRRDDHKQLLGKVLLEYNDVYQSLSYE